MHDPALSYSVNRARGLRRRLLGLLVLMGFVFFTVEPLLADECDGDFSLVSICAVPSSAQGPASGSAPSPAHAVHVCHCVHAHGGIPASVERDPSVLADDFTLVGTIALLPASPALDRDLRPPIV